MKHSFKNSNTIVIQGWMINELNLSGNELILYALIYGFSQDGESEFYGSLNYVSTALNCSKPTAIKALNSLIDKNYIFKNQNSINGIVYSKYTANVNFFNGSKETLLVKNDELGSKESLRGSKETLPNNNIYNNIYNNETQIFEKEFDLPKKQTKQKKEIARDVKLFVDSIWNDYEKVKQYFLSKPDYVEKYAYCDLKHYINKVDLWSENSGTKRTDRGWIGTIVDFIDQAKTKGEMRTIDKPKKQQGHTNH